MTAGRDCQEMQVEVPVAAHARGPGRPKDSTKRIAIVLAAKSLFISYGFSGTSIAAVASQARVSKITVYKYFHNKEKLYQEVVQFCLSEVIPKIQKPSPPSATVSEQLLVFALQYVRAVSTPEIVRLLRAILGNFRHGVPGCGALIWDEGLRRLHRSVERLLRQVNRSGELSIPDTARASVQFLSIITGDVITDRLMYGDVNANWSISDAEQTARDGVAAFLVAYTAQPQRG